MDLGSSIWRELESASMLLNHSVNILTSLVDDWRYQLVLPMPLKAAHDTITQCECITTGPSWGSIASIINQSVKLEYVTWTIEC